MLLALKKKQSNISEYLMYMYQTEDLIRQFNFDLNQINNYVLKHIPTSEQEKKELLLWYASIIEKMQNEKIQTKGHLQELINLVGELTELHAQLEATNATYQNILSKADSYFKQQGEASGNTITNPVQLSLNAVYGFLLLKLKGKNISDEQQAMLNSFGDILSYLSFMHKKETNSSKNTDSK